MSEELDVQKTTEEKEPQVKLLTYEEAQKLAQGRISELTKTIKELKDSQSKWDEERTRYESELQRVKAEAEEKANFVSAAEAARITDQKQFDLKLAARDLGFLFPEDVLMYVKMEDVKVGAEANALDLLKQLAAQRPNMVKQSDAPATFTDDGVPSQSLSNAPAQTAVETRARQTLEGYARNAFG